MKEHTTPVGKINVFLFFCYESLHVLLIALKLNYHQESKNFLFFSYFIFTWSFSLNKRHRRVIEKLNWLWWTISCVRYFPQSIIFLLIYWKRKRMIFLCLHCKLFILIWVIILTVAFVIFLWCGKYVSISKINRQKFILYIFVWRQCKNTYLLVLLVHNTKYTTHKKILL